MQSLKKASYISLAALAVLLLGAIVYYKERVLFLDASYISFTVITDGALALQENRIGAFITQMVPLIGSKIHLPIKAILLLYSASFNIFYLSVAAILVYRYRQYTLAILMGLYYVLFVSDTFFWSNNEVHQGIAWMFLALGVVMREKKMNSILLFVLFTVFSALAISSHMLVMMPFVFLWCYIMCSKSLRPFAVQQAVLYSVVLLALVATKYYMSVHQSYDGTKLAITHKFELQDLYWRAKDKFGVHFIISCFTKYWVVPIVFVLGMYALVKEKKWLHILMTLGGCGAYYMLMCLTFVNAGYEFQPFHIESEWMALGILAAAPFVFHFLPRIKANHAIMLLCFVFAVRIAYIINAAPFFVHRADFIAQVVDKMKAKGINKLVLQPDSELEKALLFDWATPHESILQSAINGDKPQCTFVVLPGNNISQPSIDSKRNYIGSFANIDPFGMNLEYFNIGEQTPYTVMTYQQLMQ